MLLPTSDFVRVSRSICALAFISFLTIGCKEDDATPSVTTISDVDGNTYKTVIINNQEWFAENLRSTRFNDGSAIPNITDKMEWATLSAPGYCWFNNFDGYKDSKYGALYNWYAVETDKLCPVGWHVPTEEEWVSLSEYLGGESVSGGKLKEAGIEHWLGPNTEATNTSGFTALPAGWRSRYNCEGCNNGEFAQLNYYGFYWSSTEYDLDPDFDFVYYHFLSFDRASLDLGAEDKTNGFSCRCVKDVQAVP